MAHSYAKLTSPFLSVVLSFISMSPSSSVILGDFRVPDDNFIFSNLFLSSLDCDGLLDLSD